MKTVTMPLVGMGNEMKGRWKWNGKEIYGKAGWKIL